MTFAYRGSVLFVRNLAASRHFYEGVLGQKVSEDFGAYVGFQGGFGIWDADYALRMIYAGAPPEGEEKQVRGVELYFESEDLDAARAALLAAGAPLVHDLREQPWGQRVLRVTDPDGTLVEVGEPIAAVVRRCLAQGMTIAEAARRIDIPLEMAEKAASGK